MLLIVIRKSFLKSIKKDTCFTIIKMNKITNEKKSKFWSVVLTNPTKADKQLIDERLEKIDFAIYGFVIHDDNDVMIDCLIKFHRVIGAGKAKAFFPAGCWRMVDNLQQELEDMDKYEFKKTFGFFPLQSVKKELF